VLRDSLMVILFPSLGFYYGMYVQQKIDQNQPPKQTIVYKVVKSNPTTCSQPPDGMVACRTGSDCPVGYTCALGGPIVASPKSDTPRRCYKNGDAIPN